MLATPITSMQSAPISAKTGSGVIVNEEDITHAVGRSDPSGSVEGR